MTLPARLDPIDIRITTWMARHGVTLTRLALGVVFLWFGIIKFVPTWSPAAELATRTIERLTLGGVPPTMSLPLLAGWETLIGLGLLSGRYLRVTLASIPIHLHRNEAEPILSGPPFFAVKPPTRMPVAAGVVVVLINMAVTVSSQGPSLQPVPRIPGVFGDDSVPELVRDGFVFTEGPVGTADSGLYFTDTGIQPTRIYRLEPDGRIHVFRDTLDRANGLALERTGALIAAESNGGRVSRVEADGTVTPLVAQAAPGRALVNPNDLIADRRGGIYFTDFVRGQRGAPAYVYYRPPGAAQALVIASDLQIPNGISLAEDEKTLIVDDSRSATVYAFEIQPDGLARSRRTFATLRDIPAGGGSGADGLTIDRAGRVYVTTAVGVQMFDSAGQYLGTLAVPSIPSNVAFSGPDKRTLYITARTGLYRVRTSTQGLARPGSSRRQALRPGRLRHAA